MPFDSGKKTGTGFKFTAYEPGALVSALAEAVGVYKRPKHWERLVANGMGEDFSWDRSAKRYTILYQALTNRTGKKA